MDQRHPLCPDGVRPSPSLAVLWCVTLGLVSLCTESQQAHNVFKKITSVKHSLSKYFSNAQWWKRCFEICSFHQKILRYVISCFGYGHIKMKHGLREKSLLKQGVTGASIQKLGNSGSEGILDIPQTNPLTVVSSTPLSALGIPRSDDWCPWWKLRWCWRSTSAWNSFSLSGEWGGSAPREGGWGEVLSDRWVGSVDLLQSFYLIRVNLCSSMPSLSRDPKYK